MSEYFLDIVKNNCPKLFIVQKSILIFRQNRSVDMILELKDGIVSTNSDGVYWKLLTPGNYFVKAVVFSKNGKELEKNDWSDGSPSMESSTQKVTVKTKNKSSRQPDVPLKEAQILNLVVNPIQ